MRERMPVAVRPALAWCLAAFVIATVGGPGSARAASGFHRVVVDTVTVTMEPFAVAAGECARCSISTSDVTGLGVLGFQFKLRYDPELLRVSDVEIACPIACGWAKLAHADSVLGQLVVLSWSAFELAGSGNLVYITFCNRTGRLVDNCQNPMFLENVKVGSSAIPVKVRYPCEVSAVVDLIGVQGRLWARPNPFEAGVEILGAGGPDAIGELEIYDVRGRRILATRVVSPGPGARSIFTWDGRDDRGSSVSRGTYFVRWSSDGFERSVKLVRKR
ncbi:MAG: hypothetical protein ACE5G2_02585 [Candidatus Krumholzibacteriia bacterium]